MYTGTNPTALRSQAVIAQAALFLMEKKDFSKITVKEICREADLSRQTFYEFFESKEAAVKYCIRLKLFTLQDRISIVDRKSIEGYFNAHIAGNKSFLRLLARNNLGNLFSEELSESLNELEEHLDPGRDRNSQMIANAFLTSALVSSFLVWADDKVKISEKAFVELIYQIIRGQYFRVE